MNPNSKIGNEIEKPCHEPIVVGCVTPRAPRLQPEVANDPRRCMFIPLENPLICFCPVAAFRHSGLVIHLSLDIRH
jgi:hypothetical protein